MSLTGPLPKQLIRHPHFNGFETGIALDGPPLPAVTNRRQALNIVILPVLFGYADLASDVHTALSYLMSGHLAWCVLGLLFALAPSVVVAVFFVRDIGWRRILVAMQLGLIYEAFHTVKSPQYSPTLALLRVVGPLCESLPELLMQLYVMMMYWETTPSSTALACRVVSVCISTLSLAHAATDISSVEMLQTAPVHETSTVHGCCTSLTEAAFSRVPAAGILELGWMGEVRVGSYVWFCFVYHLLEVVSRFVPLTLLALVMRGWFVLVLLYLWLSRCCVILGTVLISTEDDALRQGYRAAACEGGKVARRRAAADFRFRVRMVAMPFLDSIMDGKAAFLVGLWLTLVESIVFIAVYHGYLHDRDLDTHVRRVFTAVAIGCMVGKMLLALVVIVPLKADINAPASAGSSVTDSRALGDEESALALKSGSYEAISV